ncbi:hypothetical protein [Microcoleus sp. MON2_D5]|uniref:hypothetical protein n=1 Tax=Microcoleus sp. MON2_D5 TaxID=2818833 RepID=UPI002FD3BB26
MYSEFDASEFDYLNTDNFSQPENQTVAKTPEITNIERFWTLTGNWGEFGSYFGAGLSASLIVRAIPALIPSAVIFFPAVSLAVGIYSLGAEGIGKTRAHLILLAVAVALISANWDAWTAWVVFNSQLLIFSLVLTVVTVCFVGVQIWSKLSDAGK